MMLALLNLTLARRMSSPVEFATKPRAKNIPEGPKKVSRSGAMIRVVPVSQDKGWLGADPIENPQPNGGRLVMLCIPGAQGGAGERATSLEADVGSHQKERRRRSRHVPGIQQYRIRGGGVHAGLGEGIVMLLAFFHA